MNTERVIPTKGCDSTRGRQLRRQWEIYALLKANRHGMTARQISNKVKTPYRTVVRDLDCMSSVMPLYYDVESRRTYKWKLLPER